MKSSNNSVPKHVGIILDGNRRFAKRLMLKPWKGHEWGAEKVEKVLEWGNELGVRELTLYTLSLENFNRPKTEFNYLMELFKKEFKRLSKAPQLQEKEIRINFIGRLWMLDEELQQILKGISNKTMRELGGVFIGILNDVDDFRKFNCTPDNSIVLGERLLD